MSGIWAVIPVKEMEGSKQRLASLLTGEQRQQLAAIMLQDVLDAVATAHGLAGIILVTRDPFATTLGKTFGARIVTEGARDGHTGAVTAAGRILVRENAAGLLTVPGDIPRITASEIETALAAHCPAPAFTIVPAHDEKGSNCVILSPPDSVRLRFGEDSFFPHLEAARQQGIEPTIVPLPGIGMDIDHPADIFAFLRMAPRVRTPTLDFLEESGIKP